MNEHTDRYFHKNAKLFVILGVLMMLTGGAQLLIGGGTGVLFVTLGLLHFGSAISLSRTPILTLHDDHLIWKPGVLAPAKFVAYSDIDRVEQRDLGYWKGGVALCVSSSTGELAMPVKVLGEEDAVEIEERLSAR